MVEAQPVPERSQEPRLGLRGDQLSTAVAALAVVFVLGFAVVVAVLMSRRKPRA